MNHGLNQPLGWEHCQFESKRVETSWNEGRLLDLYSARPNDKLFSPTSTCAVLQEKGGMGPRHFKDDPLFLLKDQSDSKKP